MSLSQIIIYLRAQADALREIISSLRAEPSADAKALCVLYTERLKIYLKLLDYIETGKI